MQWPWVSRKRFDSNYWRLVDAERQCVELRRTISDLRSFAVDRLENLGLARMWAKRAGGGQTYQVSLQVDETLLRSMWMRSDVERLTAYFAHQLASSLHECRLEGERWFDKGEITP